MKAAGLAAVLFAAGLTGCQHKAKPFEDVTSRQRMQPTQAPATRPVASKPPVRPAEALPPTGVESAQAPQSPTAVPPSTQPVAGPEGIPTGGVVIPASPQKVIVLYFDQHGHLRRQWSQSTAYTASGDVYSGPTYWPGVGKEGKLPDPIEGFWEPAEFLLNIGLLPVRGVITPPWKRVINSESGPAGQEHLTYGQPQD